jgi:hypothetical protein
LIAGTEVGQVVDLVGPPQPNYVLLYDSRYRELWGWYQRLRRQQNEQDSVWRWRHRVWAETCLLAVSSCLEQAQERHGMPVGCEGVVYLRSEQDAGRFLDARSPLGPWAVETAAGPRRVHLILPEHFETIVGENPWLTRYLGLAPDFVLVAHDPARQLAGGRWLGVWTSLDSGLQGEAVLDESLGTLYRALRRCRFDRRFHGLLLQPALPSADAGASPGLAEHGRPDALLCLGFSIPLPMQERMDWLNLAVESLLGLEEP